MYYAVTAILDPGIAPNHGSYLPVEVMAPEGSVLDPLSPAPVVGRNVFTHRVATGRSGHAGKALPDQAITRACGQLQRVHPLRVRRGRACQRAVVEIERGGWGGRRGLDGPDCLLAGVHNLANGSDGLSRERVPAFRVLTYALRPDSGGRRPVPWRLGAERSLEVLIDCELSCQFDHVKFPPPGLSGAASRGSAKLLVEGDGVIVELPGKVGGHRLGREIA